MPQSVLRSRSNSMDDVHETAGGGVRSQARLEVVGEVYRTSLFNTDTSKGGAGTARRSLPTREAERDRDHFGKDSMGISRNDAEVHVLDQARRDFKEPLKALRNSSSLKSSRTVTVEYHGNHGPCLDCQTRFETANKEFAGFLPVGTSLQSSVHYTQAPHEGRGGSTLYGYEGDAVNQHYGAKKTPLFVHGLATEKGRWKPRVLDTVKSDKPSPQPSQFRNSFAGLDFGSGGGGGSGRGSKKNSKKAEGNSPVSEAFVTVERATAPKIASQSKTSLNEPTDRRSATGSSSQSHLTSTSSAKPSNSWRNWGIGIGFAGGGGSGCATRA